MLETCVRRWVDHDFGPGSYKPTMPVERAEAIRRWHEAALAAMRSEAGQVFDYLGLRLAVPPEIQPITGMSHLLGDAVVAEARASDRVLDMGTGCGVNAILAARSGARVLAVDINPIAVTTARCNAAANGFGGHVEVRASDVYWLFTIQGVVVV